MSAAEAGAFTPKVTTNRAARQDETVPRDCAFPGYRRFLHRCVVNATLQSAIRKATSVLLLIAILSTREGSTGARVSSRATTRRP